MEYSTNGRCKCQKTTNDYYNGPKNPQVKRALVFFYWPFLWNRFSQCVKINQEIDWTQIIARRLSRMKQISCARNYGCCYTNCGGCQIGSDMAIMGNAEYASR